MTQQHKVTITNMPVFVKFFAKPVDLTIWYQQDKRSDDTSAIGPVLI